MVAENNSLPKENLLLKNIVSDLKLNGLAAEKADALFARLSTQSNVIPILSLQATMSNENVKADMSNENVVADMTNEGVKADVTNEQLVSATVTELANPELSISQRPVTA